MTQPATAAKVFLSHTSEMAEHPKQKSFVQAALDAVREVDMSAADMSAADMSAADMSAADMRDFPAASMSPMELDTELLLECSIYIGILGFRFGMPAREQQAVSYTQHEFRVAKNAGMPLLIFLLHEEAEGLPGTVFRDREFGEQQEAFRQEVLNLDGKGLVCQFFKTADELQRLIVRALQFKLTSMSRERNTGRSGIAQFEAALQTYCALQVNVWKACLEGKHDRQDRLDHYVEPNYSLLKPEAQSAMAGDRFGSEKSHPAPSDEDGHHTYEPVAADGDDAETELSKLLTVSSRLCLAEDAGAGKSVFTRRALAFACSQQGLTQSTSSTSMMEKTWLSAQCDSRLRTSKKKSTDGTTGFRAPSSCSPSRPQKELLSTDCFVGRRFRSIPSPLPLWPTIVSRLLMAEAKMIQPMRSCFATIFEIIDAS